VTIGLSTVVVRVEGVLSSPVDDEVVLLDPHRDSYFGLDAVGRSVWELLEQPHRVDHLCRRLSTQFEATPEQIAADMVPFLEKLTTKGIVTIVAG
jgi:hypothetical protein